MSVQYQIDQAWLVHESGTKFYHPIRLMRTGADGTRIVTAFHYGGFRGDHTLFRRPISGGQGLVKTEDVFDKQIAAKKRSGYTLAGTWNSPSNEGEFRTYLIHMFGRSYADQIFVGLGMLPGDALVVSDTDEADLRPTSAGDHIPVDTPIERPAAWGSW